MVIFMDMDPTLTCKSFIWTLSRYYIRDLPQRKQGIFLLSQTPAMSYCNDCYALHQKTEGRLQEGPQLLNVRAGPVLSTVCVSLGIIAFDILNISDSGRC